jgi:hypothetical protein
MRGGTRFKAPRRPKFIITQGAVGEDDAKKPKHDDKARVKRHDNRNARGVNKIIFLANGEQERERSSNSGVGEGERFFA